MAVQSGSGTELGESSRPHPDNFTEALHTPHVAHLPGLAGGIGVNQLDVNVLDSHVCSSWWVSSSSKEVLGWSWWKSGGMGHAPVRHCLLLSTNAARSVNPCSARIAATHQNSLICAFRMVSGDQMAWERACPCATADVPHLFLSIRCAWRFPFCQDHLCLGQAEHVFTLQPPQPLWVDGGKSYRQVRPPPAPCFRGVGRISSGAKAASESQPSQCRLPHFVLRIQL